MQNTKLSVVQENLTTELSTYKQELIEWAEGKKLNADPSLAFLQRESDGKVLDYYSCNSYDLALTDLINHIKGEK